MKFIIIALAIAAVASAQQQPQQFAILRQAQDIAPDGSYNYQYETENGIAGTENGQLGPTNQEGQQAIVAQGQYQYTAPDGTLITLRYTADENGFQPQGGHLPVAPAIPPQIQRALDYIAARSGKTETYKQQYNRQF